MAMAANRVGQYWTGGLVSTVKASAVPRDAVKTDKTQSLLTLIRVDLSGIPSCGLEN